MGMISKKVLAVFAVAALAAGLAIAPAMAKKGCGKLCKDNKKTCLLAAKEQKQACKGLSGDEKKACKDAAKVAKKACITDHQTRLSECKAADDGVAVQCDSPSSAFLD